MITVNAFLAIIAALVTVGTINKMNGITDNAVRVSVLMLFVGLLAQGLGVIFKQWDHYADTIMYAGIASLAISSRRLPCGIPLAWREPIVYSTAVILVLHVLIGLP